MTVPLSAEGRQLLKTAAHDFGAVVAVALIGTLIGAAIGTTFYFDSAGMIERNVGFIGAYGLIGGTTGGIIISGVLAASAFLKGFRLKLVTIFRRASRLLTCCSVLGGCSALTTTYLVFINTTAGFALASSPAGYIALLITCGAGYGIAAGFALGLVVILLTLLFMAAVALTRISAGFLCPANKGAGARPADLAGDAGTPWPIQTAAALMPSEAGRRWRDDFDEARYDYEEDQYPKLLRDFLAHAPAVVILAWIAAVQHHVIGAGTSRRHR